MLPRLWQLMFYYHLKKAEFLITDPRWHKCFYLRLKLFHIEFALVYNLIFGREHRHKEKMILDLLDELA
jgi:hypothetical protein